MKNVLLDVVRKILQIYIYISKSLTTEQLILLLRDNKVIVLKVTK